MTYQTSEKKIENLKCAISSTASKLVYRANGYYVVGSNVDYTPAVGASFVEYRLQALANYAPDANDLLQFSLRYDDTVSLNPATQYDQFTDFSGAHSAWGGNVNSQSNLLNLRFTLPAWTGERRLLVFCRAYADGLRGTLHWTDQFRSDDVDAVQATADTFVFDPHYIIYSVR
ncbi:MAG: hypothetical protein CMJ25_31645 [Phycisphaerae bacterium]|nr:hypothetical protein [Phycisphaerae bacterium]|tara:strand:- start:188 stop:706 length:519 start_codon:yes stop_codon:yes gene_type:complete